MSINRTLCRDQALPAPLSAGAIISTLATAALRAFCAMQQWRERAQQRARLASLDDRMLKDIGISRASANFEASKPFWRP